MKKLICVLLSAVLTAAVFAGCEKKGAEENGTDAAVNNTTGAVTIGSTAVDESVLDYYLMMSAASVQAETGKEPGWEKKELASGEIAKDAVIEIAFDEMHAAFAMVLKARELGLYSEEDEKQFVEDAIASEFPEGSEQTYEDWLKENNVSDAAARHSVGANGAFMEILNGLCTEEDAQKAFEEEYMCVKHILILFDGDGTGDDDTKTLAKANAAYDRAVGGESFEDLINELGEDPGLDVEGGYVFTDNGQMVKEFESASKALKVGEISKPVRTTYGYHVIKRYPLPEKGTESYDAYVENVRGEKGYAKYQAEQETLLKEWKSEFEMKVPDGLKEKIDLSKYNG